MARKSLKPQLNQIRAWVRQGRTDAWIAHQLEISASELREFRRQHELNPDDEPGAQTDLRDEIEAEIEAAREEEPDEEDLEDLEDEEDEGSEEPAAEEPGDTGSRAERRPRRTGERGGQRSGERGEAERPKRRRRGGRGRSRGRKAAEFEATFDHGEKEGYGLWLDPAVKDDPAYKENWAGKRAIIVTVEAERIVIKRADSTN